MTAEATTSLAEAVARLYGGSLDRFVADRNDLAREVRAAGDRTLADEIKALRKPTVVADALNRAIRGDPDALEQLLDAAAGLRRTQEAMLVGEPADFEADRARYRAAAEEVAGNAPSHGVEVRAALEAAAVDGLVDELRAAAFAAPPEPAAGFGPFVAGPGTKGPGSPTAERPGAGRRPADDGGPGERGGPSAAERRMAERVRGAAEQAVAEAEAEHLEASGAATTAAERVAALDADLAGLAERLETTRRERDEAVVTRAEAEAVRAAAGRRLDEARSALDEL